MTPGVWGAVTAASWGTADFIARFSGRAVGHHAALFGMLLTGSALLSMWVWLTDAALVWAADRLWLVGLSGLSIMLATRWLYQGLAHGPISIVSPIVGSYPALIVAFAVVAGVRPSLWQSIAMAATTLGVVIVARSGGGSGTDARSRGDLRATILISLASATAFAVGVFTAQLAVPVYGELQTTWLSRLTSLAALLLLFIGRGRPRIPARWWPAVMSQGCLDTGGYLALYAGSHGAGSEIAAVTASAFGAVTTLLAWILLRESIGWLQWLGIALVFAGVAALSA
jgi:drug/metabolite transporter (DMT)-like permease